jgi:signal peptidase II
MKIPVHYKLFGWIAAAVFVIDQITKWWAIQYLTLAYGESASSGERLSQFLWQRHPEHREAIAVTPDFWHFRYVENPGAAWGFLSRADSPLRTPFFLILSLIAMAFIISYYRKTAHGQNLLRVSLALVFGGAVGNFFDRIRLGYVIDFIDWHWYDKATWPTFNMADAAISIGVVLMLLDMFLQKPQKTAKKA